MFCKSWAKPTWWLVGGWCRNENYNLQQFLHRTLKPLLSTRCFFKPIVLLLFAKQIRGCLMRHSCEWLLSWHLRAGLSIPARFTWACRDECCSSCSARTSAGFFWLLMWVGRVTDKQVPLALCPSHFTWQAHLSLKCFWHGWWPKKNKIINNVQTGFRMFRDRKCASGVLPLSVKHVPLVCLTYCELNVPNPHVRITLNCILRP